MASEGFVGEWKITDVGDHSQHGTNGTTGVDHIVRIGDEPGGFCVACTRCSRWGAKHSKVIDGKLHGEGTFGEDSDQHKFTIELVKDPLSGKKTIKCSIEPSSHQDGSWQPGSWTAEDLSSIAPTAR